MYVILWLLAGLMASFIGLIVHLTRTLEKMEWEFPMFKWTTREEMLAMGYPLIAGCAVIRHWHKHGQLEVRIKDGIEIPETDQIILDGMGFDSHLGFKYYEFRRTVRPPRRRGKRSSVSETLEVFGGGLRPA